MEKRVKIKKIRYQVDLVSAPPPLLTRLYCNSLYIDLLTPSGGAVLPGRAITRKVEQSPEFPDFQTYEVRVGLQMVSVYA